MKFLPIFVTTSVESAVPDVEVEFVLSLCSIMKVVAVVMMMTIATAMKTDVQTFKRNNIIKVIKVDIAHTFTDS